MKNYRIDLAKGINTISDKAILAPGFVTIADGVDLRSGMARPFLGPRTLEETTANQTCIFSYRNKFFTSAECRQYVAETVNGQDRIYYTRYGGTPQQYIEGATTSLGILGYSVHDRSRRCARRPCGRAVCRESHAPGTRKKRFGPCGRRDA